MANILQTVFSNLSSTSIGYNSLFEWITSKCKSYETLVKAIADKTTETVNDTPDATVFTYLTDTVHDGFIQTASVTMGDIRKAIDEGVDEIRILYTNAQEYSQGKLSQLAEYAAQSVAKLYAAADAFKALAICQVDSTRNVLTEYTQRIQLRFASLTSAAASIGYSVINILQDASMTVKNKIQSLLSILGFSDITEEKIGIPVQSISGYSFDSPIMAAISAAGSIGSFVWGQICKIADTFGDMIKNAVLGALQWTTYQVKEWWYTTQGTGDAYGSSSTADVRQGPCFSDFNRVLKVKISGTSDYTSIYDEMKYAVIALGLAEAPTTVSECAYLLSRTNVLVDTIVETLRDHFYEAWIATLDEFYYSTSNDKLSRSEYELLNEERSRVALAGEKKTDTIKMYADFWYLVGQYIDYDVPVGGESLFLEKISETQYIRMEAPGAFISCWRYGDYIYMAFSYRPMDNVYLATQMDLMTREDLGFKWSKDIEYFNTLTATLTSAGWTDPSHFASDDEMLVYISTAASVTARYLGAMRYQYGIDCGESESTASNAADLVHMKMAQLLNVPSSYSGGVGLAGAQLASLLLCGRVTSTPDQSVIVTGTHATALLEALTFINNDSYYCAYIHTGSLPDGMYHVKSSKEVAVYVGATTVLVTVVVVALVGVVLGAILKHKAFALEAAAGNISWSSFSLDKDGKKVICNLTSLKLARKAYRNLRLVNTMQNLLGKGASEAATATTTLLEQVSSMNTNAASVTTTTGSDGITGDDTASYNLKNIVQLIRGY